LAAPPVAVAEPEVAATPAPSCLDELPPVPRAEPPEVTPAGAAKPAAKKTKVPPGAANGAVKKPAAAAKRTSAAKATRPAKKAPGPVQQQLPADASS
jgi:hypothetical protein